MIKSKRFFVTFLIILLTVAIIIGWHVMEKETERYDVSKLAPSYFNATDNDLIYLTALKENYSHFNKYIKVVLTNDSDNPIMYGYPLQLETFINDKWYKVPMKENHAFLLVGIYLKAHSNATLDIPLDDFQCLPGKHRIIKGIREATPLDNPTETSNNIKPVNKKDIYIAVEFNLN